jgi:hypothetical protein
MLENTELKTNVENSESHKSFKTNPLIKTWQQHLYRYQFYNDVLMSFSIWACMKHQTEPNLGSQPSPGKALDRVCGPQNVCAHTFCLVSFFMTKKLF